MEVAIATGRRYYSPTRLARAAETRERIASAAERLFVQQGFARVTISALAAEARVSEPTVYATFGSKAGLLLDLLARMEARVDGTAWMAAIEAEQDPSRRLALFAAWSRELYESGSDLIRVAHQARGEPDVAELHAEGDRRRRATLATAAPAVDGEAIDRAYVLSSPMLYLMCVDDCGWTPDAYQRWLERLLIHELLGDGAPNPAAGSHDQGARKPTA